MSDADERSRFRSGLVYGLVAYTLWGAVPLYFTALKDHGVPAKEILAHRIVWSLPVLLALTAVAGGWRDLGRVLASRKLVLTLLLSAVLLAVNWLLYIQAAVTERVAEASLGYFMLPLVNAALATLVLGERLRPAHFPALLLIVAAVAGPALAGGFVPWLGLMLAVSFGLYGLARKQVPVEGMTGLTVESLLMLPPAVGYLVWLWLDGTNHMGPDVRLDALLAFSGVMTVAPLLTFTLSIRRLPLLAMSFLQFVSPTIQLLIAVYVIGKERMTDEKLWAFGCVWAAVLIFVADAVWQARRRRVRRAGFGVGNEDVRNSALRIPHSALTK